jgi:rhodanese-related sulfurtransferase
MSQPMSAVPTINTGDLPTAIPDDLRVVDVREDDEWAAGHIEAAQHIPLWQLPARLDELPGDRRLLVVCRVGARSGQAVRFLIANGRDAVNLAGGMQAWQRARRPMVADAGVPPTVI